MKKVLLTFILIFGAFALIQAQNITIESMDFGTDVQDRQIVGADSVFANTVGAVYCFTHVVGVQDTADIAHIWYHEGDERANVTLNVRSNSWRTWSSKNILEAWTGQWSVDVVGPNGDVIATESFTIEEGEGGME